VIDRLGQGVPTFVEHTKLRLLMGTLLYLAQGLPQGVLFYGIPTWLAVSGQSATAVGSVVAAVSLPWSLKFLAGALIDRYTFLPMGRRRVWLIGAQVGIVLNFLVLMLINPSVDEIAIIVAMVFFLSSLTALQDVALDAMVIDLTPIEERGRLNGFMFAGKLVGIGIGTSLTGFLLEFYGFQAAMLAAMILFAIPAVSAVLIRERPGERYLPWTKGYASPESIAIKPTAWLPIIRDSLQSMLRRDPLLVIALSFSYGIHQGIHDSVFPLFAAQQLGWGEARYGSIVASANILAAIGALTLGGWATDRFGPGRLATWIMPILVVIVSSLLIFDNLWQGTILFVIWIYAYQLVVILFYLCMLTLGMRVCEPKVAATTYTLIMASMAVGMTVGAGSLGQLEQLGGFSAMFFAMIVSIFVSGSMAFGLSQQAGGAALKPAGGSPSESVAALEEPGTMPN